MTIVASASTVPKRSPTASSSLYCLTAWKAKSNSGITVQSHITPIPIITGLTHMASAIAIPDVTTKWAQSKRSAILHNR